MALHLVLILIVLLTAPALGQAPAPAAPGPPVDRSGGPSIDPTENVKALSEAAGKRQDDLREAQQKLFQSQLRAQEQISALRFEHAQQLARSQAQKLEDEAKLRAEYASVLALAEAKRIDAIRAVDVNAVAVANQRTSEQATALQTQTTASAEVLRNQVARSAEDLRALVATTAATALQNQQQQFAGMSARITTLEQAGSEFKGKQTFQDPTIAALVSEVRSLREARSSSTGSDTGQSQIIAWVIAGLAVLIAMGGLITSIIVANKKPPPVYPPTIYSPPNYAAPKHQPHEA